jgi:hypothetical protein
MRKHLWTLSVVALLALSLAACGDTCSHTNAHANPTDTDPHTNSSDTDTCVWARVYS